MTTLLSLGELVHFDLRPLYWGALIIGLILIGSGLAIRLKLPKFGLFIAMSGALPALAGGVLLLATAVGAMRDYRDRALLMQLGQDETIQGIRLPAGAMIETSGSPRTLQGVTLPKPWEILGIPMTGHVEFSGRGISVLQGGMLAADHVIDGIPCKAQTWVKFSWVDEVTPEDGGAPKTVAGKLKHCELAADADFEGVKYAANSTLDMEDGGRVGTLAAADQTVTGVPCQGGTEVQFKPIGGVLKLVRCTVSAAFDFDGVRYASGSEWKLNDQGKVGSGVLAADQEVEGHFCRKGTVVQRYEERLDTFTLARDETIEGVACKADHKVQLDPKNGRVTTAVLASDQQFGELWCRRGEPVEFQFDSGRLDACVLSRPATLVNVVWPSGTRLEALANNFTLRATLPVETERVTIGEVVALGHCKVDIQPQGSLHLYIDSPGKGGGFIEVLGARFKSINLNDYGNPNSSANSFGTLAAPATINGTAYATDAQVPLKGVRGPMPIEKPHP